MKAAHRFFFGTLLFSLVLFLGLGGWILHRATTAEWARFEAMMDTTDRLIQAENQDLLWNLDASGITANAEHTFQHPEVARLRILDPAGVVTVNLGDSHENPDLIRVRRFEIRRDGRLLAEVDVGYSTELVLTRIRRWRAILFGLIAVLAGILLLVHFELHQNVWRPIGALTADMRGDQKGVVAGRRMAAEVSDCVEAYINFTHTVQERRKIDRIRIEKLEKRSADLEAKIREKETSEAALRQAQKMEAVARISGGVGAEFNNLLTSILGFSAMARDQLKPNQQAYADIEEVLHAGERARTLTQQLLSLGRCRQLEMRRYPVAALLEDIRKNVEAHVGSNIEVETHFEAEAGYVFGDDGALLQVFSALADNAREATPKRGRVTLESKEVFLSQDDVRHLPDLDPGSYILLAFMDTGLGMTPEVREQAIEPFFTTRGPTHTGLGLSTAHGIVRQCKGNLELYSERGRGTQILVYLPLHTAEVVEEAVQAQPEKPRGEPVGGTETVLVAEDEETVRRMSRRLLEAKGYTVLDAADGDEGLRVAADYSEPIHLILSDVVMPTLNGPDMVQKLRESRPDCKVLYMSGFAEAKLPDIDETGRAVNLMLKPFTREILYRRVREVLDDDSPPAPV